MTRKEKAIEKAIRIAAARVARGDDDRPFGSTISISNDAIIWQQDDGIIINAEIFIPRKWIEECMS